MFHISSADNPNIFFMSVVVYYAMTMKKCNNFKCDTYKMKKSHLSLSYMYVLWKLSILKRKNENCTTKLCTWISPVFFVFCIFGMNSNQFLPPLC